jgi:7-cyano-7-deazaguanine reductase
MAKAPPLVKINAQLGLWPEIALPAVLGHDEAMTDEQAEAGQRAESFRLLGQPTGKYPEKPSRDILDTFPNRSPGRLYWITFDCPEFTSLCPVTGQPDFAALSLHYVPGELCVETKSLKFYLASFRHTPSFNEEIVNRILDDLAAVCAPRAMVVRGKFSPRGGISVRVEARFPDDGALPPPPWGVSGW